MKECDYFSFFLYFCSQKSMEATWKEIKYNVFDWLRFPLVLLVVFLHCKGKPEDMQIDWVDFGLMDIYNILRIYISCIISGVAVLLFFTISGYLFYNRVIVFSFRTYINKIERRLKTLLVPYVFWIFLYMAGNVILIIHGSDGVSAWDVVKSYIVEHRYWHIFWDCWSPEILKYPPIGFLQDNSAPLLIPMWFVRDLFVVSLLSPILWFGVKKADVIFVLVLGACFILKLWPYIHGVSIQSFFFFSLGILLSKHEELMDVFFHRWGGALILISFLLSFYLVYLFNLKFLYYDYIYSCFTIVFCLSVLYLSYICVQRKWVLVFLKLAMASFVIYASHTVFISKYIGNFVDRLGGDSCAYLFLAYLLVPIMTSCVCYLIYFVVRKYFPSLLLLLSGGR